LPDSASQIFSEDGLNGTDEIEAAREISFRSKHFRLSKTPLEASGIAHGSIGRVDIDGFAASVAFDMEGATLGPERFIAALAQSARPSLANVDLPEIGYCTDRPEPKPT
jgi:hypothetical protein